MSSNMSDLLNLIEKVRNVLLEVEGTAKSNYSDQNTIDALIDYVSILVKISHEKYPFGEFVEGGWPEE